MSKLREPGLKMAKSSLHDRRMKLLHAATTCWQRAEQGPPDAPIPQAAKYLAIAYEDAARVLQEALKGLE